jgi:hypothetical protein
MDFDVPGGRETTSAIHTGCCIETTYLLMNANSILA